MRNIGSEPGSKSVIQVEGLTKRYGKALALNRVSFDVGQGQSLALWGPNGAGKTTILRCFLGLARYDGSVLVNAINPARLGAQARRQIGYVPQDLPIPPMTVDELTAYITRLKRASLADAAARLDQLGLGAHGDKSVDALSGGLRQRLAVALALIGNPPVLLLDEPTANLDARGRADLIQLLKQLRHEGMTLVFSSHRPEDVLALADRVLLLDAGHVQDELTPVAFMRSLGETSRMVLFLRNGHLLEAISALSEFTVEATADGRVLTVSVQPQQKAQVLDRLVRAGVELEDFDVERMIWTG